MRPRGRLVVLLVAALSAALPTAAQAQASEAAVKAAFLPRFARYVNWPPAAIPRGGDPFVLCVLGDDPFGPLLDDAARSQLIDGRRITIRRLDSGDGAERCHVAFVEGSRNRPVGQMLAGLERKPVLTVTDARNSGARGLIHFAVVSGRVRFFIDNAGATKRGISISSRLLALAVGVRQ